MTKSTQKILASVLSIAMVLTVVVGVATSASADTTTTTTTTTMSPVYTRDLTVGSTGADVTALQTMLYSAGYLKVSPTGYFGSLTQAALASWQASVGISPAAGYFGPITRAYIASMTSTTVSTSTVAGCSAGAMFSSTSGAPCTTTTSTVPGCVAGAMFSSTTGAPCTSTTTSTVPGCAVGAMFSATTGASCAGSTTTVTGQGVLTVTQDPAVVTNTNITNYTNVPVYGLQLQAQLGSVSINQLTLAVTDQQSGGAYENPGVFINNISIVDPSTNTVVFNEPVSSANFIVNPSNSTSFYIQLTGLNYTIPANTTKDLVVEVNTAGSIDLARTVTVAGYGSNSLQYFTGNNIVNYNPISGITTTNIFQTSSNSVPVFGVDSTNPISATNYVNTNSGDQGVTLLAFNVQSSSGSITLTNASGTITTTGTAPTAAYLYDGSTLVSSVSLTAASSTGYTFNNFSDVVTSGTSKVFTVRADFPGNTNPGTAASTTLSSITYTTGGGQITTSTTNGLPLAGNNQTFYTATPGLTFVSGSATTQAAQYSGGPASLAGTLVFTVHPQPGQMVQPIASDFRVLVGPSLSASDYTVPVASTSIQISNPTPTIGAPLAANSTYTVTLSPYVNYTNLNGGANAFYLVSASTTVNNINGTPVTSTMGTTSLSNFYTVSATVTK